MIGFRYFKGSPTNYYLHYSSSKIKRRGAGLSFWYWEPTSVLISVPMQTQDFPFAFMQYTKDFQEITIQGQLTFRVVEPEKLAALVNHTIDHNGTYESNAPDSLSERIIQSIQIATKEIVQSYFLIDVVDQSENITRTAITRVQNDQLIQMLGIEILTISIHHLSPNPTMVRALEATTRERMQKEADEAIYARRNSAVEQERLIKENELKTEIAVEEKRKQIREAQIAADIAVEHQRETLINQKVQNDKKEAEARAYTLEATLQPLRGMDWKILMAAQEGNFNPQSMIAMAFREMAENANKIGELNISPDLLNSLLKEKK